MADLNELKARYPKMAQSDYMESAEQRMAEAEEKKTQPQAASSPTANLMRFIRQHPDIQRLKTIQATSANQPRLREEIGKVRVALFKEMCKAKDHDLTPDEIQWAADVLAGRVNLDVSVANMQSNLETDCVKDFGKLIAEVHDMRRTYDRAEAVADRFPSMNALHRKPTADEYLGIDKPGDEVPEIDLGDELEE